LDIGMLAVAAIAAVAAAVVTSKLWPGGTLISTAMTPVIVTLVKEWLRKPAERISAVSAKAPQAAARVVAPTRGAPSLSGAPRRGDRVVVPPSGSPAAGTPPEETFAEPAPGASSAYRLYRRRPPHWRLAAITGLLAFVVAALAITVPELVLGGSVAGKGSTTVFGGGSQRSSQEKGASQKTSGAKPSGDGRTTSGNQQQKQGSAPSPAGKSAQPSTGSSSSRPSTQQSPAPSGSPSQSAPSTPAPSPSGQGSAGSGAAPASGQ